MKNKVAIIDMGTNTFHLLIAEMEAGHFRITHREKVAVKLGVGGINRNLITDEAMGRSLTTMKAFKKTLDKAGIDQVLAFGTSALRNATNGIQVTERIEAETGIKTSIISGIQEAEYICLGARAAINMGERKHLIMDIGGGSVEFIIANQTRIFWSQSFEIGGQRLLERFQKHDPISEQEGIALYNYLNEQLLPLRLALEKHGPEVLIGSSGSFDTLSEMYCARESLEYRADDTETPLTIEGFYHFFQELKKRDRARRMEMPGMIELRVDMIVVACFIIDWLFQNHPEFCHLRVSTYSLKEGVLSTLFPSA